MLQQSWRIEMFGGLRARQDARVVARFRTQKTGALLAYLALHSERASSREELIEQLWPEDDLDSARTKLRMALSSLRHQLEPPDAPGIVLFADRFHIRLHSAAFTSDVADFETALQSAAACAEAGAKARFLVQACELYRAELLPGYYEEWAQTERERLAGLHLRMLGTLANALEQAGDLDSAFDYALRAVAADPLQETAHLTLMRLHLRCRQPAAALRQYRQLEQALRKELGIFPSEALRALAATLPASLDSVAMPTSAVLPSAASPDSVVLPTTETPLPDATVSGAGTLLDAVALPNAANSAPTSFSLSIRLPIVLTRFFGREDERRQIIELLQLGGEQAGEFPRLITLTGPGGSGKTRLAIEAVRQFGLLSQQSVCFVPLAEVTRAESIADAIVHSLNLADEKRADPSDTRHIIIKALASQPFLLLLDNFEQIEAGGAAFVQALLQDLPMLKCLITSRHHLGLSGERIFPILPLPIPIEEGRLRGEGKEVDGSNVPSPPASTLTRYPTPGSQGRLSITSELLSCPSVQLFLDRAQAVKPDFQITPRNAAAIAGLCAALEGIPLAIELAAGWALTLAPAQMLARLERRFEMLVSRKNDLSARHRTLRAAIAWSYDLLPSDLQHFFARLAVFRGGWTLQAAEVVCEEANALEFLALLRERSLILAIEGQEGDDALRFGMLESLREFAAEQIDPDAWDELAQRHAHYMLGLAEGTRRRAGKPENRADLTLWETEQENCRAAFAWSLAGNGDPNVALRLAVALQDRWWSSGYWTEGHDLLQRALAQTPDTPSVLRAQALNWLGSLANYRGEGLLARGYYTRTRDMYLTLNDAAGAAATLHNLGFAALELNELQEAQACFEASLHFFREAGKLIPVANALINLADVACKLGQLDRARELTYEMMQLVRGSEIEGYVALGLAGLGEIAHAECDYALARSYLEQSVAKFRERGEVFRVAQMLGILGRVALDQGDIRAATAAYQESLPLLHQLDSARAVISTLEELACCALANSQLGRAVCLLSSVRALRLPQSDAPSQGSAAPHEKSDAILEQARRRLPEDVFATAWARGQGMTGEEAVAYALETESLQNSQK